jgi:hypothetical protein
MSIAHCKSEDTTLQERRVSEARDLPLSPKKRSVERTVSDCTFRGSQSANSESENSNCENSGLHRCWWSNKRRGGAFVRTEKKNTRLLA